MNFALMRATLKQAQSRFLPYNPSSRIQKILHYSDYTQEQQRVAVVDPGKRMSFIFARCRRQVSTRVTRPRYATAAAAAAEC